MPGVVGGVGCGFVVVRVGVDASARSCGVARVQGGKQMSEVVAILCGEEFDAKLFWEVAGGVGFVAATVSIRTAPDGRCLFAHTVVTAGDPGDWESDEGALKVADDAVAAFREAFHAVGGVIVDADS